MAKYFRDWSDDTLDAQPAETTRRWNTPTPGYATKAGDATWGSKRVDEGNPGSAQMRGLSLDAVDADGDRAVAQVYAVFWSPNSGNAMPGVFVRGANAAASAVGYVCFVNLNNNTLHVERINGDTWPTAIANASFTAGIDDRVHVLLESDGTALRAKAWLDGSSEPGSWMIDTTDANVTGAGWIGVGGTYEEFGTRNWEVLGIGTGGDPAPRSEEDLADDTQLLTVASVVHAGAWTTDAGSGDAGDLATAIGGETANDATYARSELSPSSSPFVFKFSDGAPPADPSQTPRTVPFRIRKDAAGGEQIDFVLELREGWVSEPSSLGTLIATDSFANQDEVIAQAEIEMTQGEVESVTDWTALYGRVVATVPS